MNCFEAYEKEIKRLNDRSNRIEGRIKQLASMTIWADKWKLAMRDFDDMGRQCDNYDFRPYMIEKEFNAHPDKERAQDLSYRFGSACTRNTEMINAWHKVNPVHHRYCDRTLCDATNCLDT